MVRLTDAYYDDGIPRVRVALILLLYMADGHIGPVDRVPDDLAYSILVVVIVFDCPVAAAADAVAVAVVPPAVALAANNEF